MPARGADPGVAALATLWQDRPCGLEILRGPESRSDSVVADGTVCPVLTRVRREGLIEGKWAERDPGNTGNTHRTRHLTTAVGNRAETARKPLPDTRASYFQNRMRRSSGPPAADFENVRRELGGHIAERVTAVESEWNQASVPYAYVPMAPELERELHSPMDERIRETILELLARHRKMTVATLRPDGWPQATTVGYGNDDLTIYFLCGRHSQKAANLARDNRVSLAIDDDVGQVMAIQGLSMAARAHLVTDPGEAERALQLMIQRYPPQEAPLPTPNVAELRIFRVAPVVISVLDYSKGFGHTDLVTC